MGFGVFRSAGAPLSGSTGRTDAQKAIDWDQRYTDWTPAARELARAIQKRESKAQLILEELRRGPASTSTLARIGGVRFGARICELRQQGHKIITEGRADYAIYRLEGL
jgi:hypothetical protein